VSGPGPLSGAQLKAWRALKTRAEREKQGLYLAEGEHLCGEAVKEGLALAILCQADKQVRYAGLLASGLSVYTLSPAAMAMISDTKAPQGIAALCRLPAQASLQALGTRLVALNSVQDPGNVGAILRTMDAAGFTGMLLDKDSADAFSPKALRAAMGAVFRLPLRVSDDLAQDLLQLEGFDIIASQLDGDDFFARPPLGERVCLIVGNEGAGIAPYLSALATHRFRLPMPGRAESLNAAVAASIMIYDFMRVRGQTVP
jgi:TrmH family RNA methyltransferase